MCMEDVRLGRKMGPQATSIAVPDAGDTVVATQSQNRTSLIIQCNNATGLFVGPRPLVPSAGEGFFLINTLEPLYLDIQTHGSLVTQEWRASGNAGASSIVVLESFLEDQ